MSRSASDSTVREGSRRLPRGERREAILDGATQAFARAGFAATSMAEIARACAAELDLAELPTWYDLDRFDNLGRAADDLRAPAAGDPTARRTLRTFIESLAGD